MRSESGERRVQRPAAAGGAAPPEQEHLPCPRCDSTQTKFCYYNNYNLSQPRYFCKSCRRYWTHGGTLRDIPVGGGSRKNAKRSRAAAAAACSSSPSSPSREYASFRAPTSAPVLISLAGAPSLGQCSPAAPFLGGPSCASFTALLNNAVQGPEFMGLGGLGLEDMGLGSLSRGLCPLPGLAGVGGGGGPYGGPSFSGNSWPAENGEGGFVGGGDCFPWPELAISTPGGVLK